MTEMTTITGHIEIERAVEDVFDFVADERNEPTYNPDLLHSTKITDGPIGVGTRFTAARRTRRRPVEMIIEITNYDRPHQIASHTTMRAADIRGKLTFEQVETHTRMHWIWDVRPNHLAWLIAPLVRAIGSRQERTCWTGLKRHLEQQPTPR
jgi:polyketide cyclase/dehydrase/lipid transport protein